MSQASGRDHDNVTNIKIELVVQAVGTILEEQQREVV
jgi:hypothetical protein